MIVTWDKIKAFFKDSVTIFWARVQWFIGIAGAGIVAVFSGYDFNQLLSMDAKAAFKMLCMAAVVGIITEFARRRTL